MPSRNDTGLGSLLSHRLLVTFGIFVMLGLPEGVLGTAWPSIRLSFDRPVSNLASIITAYTLGYLVATLASGRLTEVFEAERATQLGVSLTVVGLAGYLISPIWSIFIISALIAGAGAGTVDSVINADIALRYGQRVMHLLHACFGIGATFGPLLVATLLEADVSWRVAYGSLAAFEGLLLLSLFTLSDQRTSNTTTDMLQERTSKARRPDWALGATLVYFALYVGAEVSVGQWSFSVLTEHRGFRANTAGLAVAGYWGGLTIGRILLAVLNDRLSETRLLRGATVVAAVSAYWFWLDTTGSLVALAVLGFAFSGIFPSLVLLTPGWLGKERVVRAVGYQLAASSGGAIVISWIVGQVARSQGLGALPGTFAILVALIIGAHLFTEWATSD